PATRRREPGRAPARAPPCGCVRGAASRRRRAAERAAAAWAGRGAGGIAPRTSPSRAAPDPPDRRSRPWVSVVGVRRLERCSRRRKLRAGSAVALGEAGDEEGVGGTLARDRRRGPVPVV